MSGTSSLYDYPDASEATIAPLTEEQLARQRMRTGSTVVFSRGRYWVETARGFYDAIHFLSRRTSDEIGRPTARCWGYRSALEEGSAETANATLPVHLVDLQRYDLSMMPSRERRRVRSLPKRGVRIVQVNTPAVFEDQGYDLLLDWQQRVGREAPPPSREEYLTTMGRRVQDQGWVVLACVDGDRLLGYQSGWAVDHTAYLHQLHISTEALRLGLSAALYYEIVEVFKRCERLVECSPGLHMPELPQLTAYKVGLGFSLVQVPARVWMLPPAGAYMRRRYPVKYYRLTGRGMPVEQTSEASD
jgi:hypothetical protein